MRGPYDPATVTGDDDPDAGEVAPTLTWSTWSEALAVVAYGPHLRRTIATALVVGTLLFAINQLDVVLRGAADASVALKIAVTYAVPFCVTNVGILVATRRGR